MTRPLLMPQYVPERLVKGNSIIAVVRSVCRGLGNGRIVGPKDKDVFGYGTEVFGEGLTDYPILTGFSMQSGPKFSAASLTIEDDEYVINATPYFSFQLARQLMFRGMRFSRPVIVNHVLFMPGEVPSGHREICASIAEFPSVFISALAREAWVSECRRYSSSSDVRRVLDRSEVVATGISCTEINAVPQNQERWTFAYCGRMAPHKGFDASLSVLEKVHSRGQTLTFLVSTFGQTSSAKLTEAARKNSFVKPHFNLARPEYLELLRRTEAFVCFSKAESYGLAWLEKIYAGQVGVFLDCPWVRAILPDYPFMVRSEIEAVAMVREIMADLPGVRAKIASFKQHIETKHNSDLCAQQFFQAAARCFEKA